MDKFQCELILPSPFHKDACREHPSDWENWPNRGGLAKLLPELGTVMAIGREEVDLADWPWLRTTIRLLEAQIIIYAASSADIDRAELEQDLAWSVNATAPGIIADEAALLGAALVHI